MEKIREQYGKFLNPSMEKQLVKTIKGEKTESLAGLTLGDPVVDYEMLVASRIVSRKTPMCPICGRRFPNAEDGAVVSCDSPVCKGQERELKMMENTVYFAGDSTGSVLLSIVPEMHKLKDDNLVGRIVRVWGKIGKDAFKSFPGVPILYVYKIIVQQNILEQNMSSYLPYSKDAQVSETIEEKPTEEWVEHLRSLCLLHSQKVPKNILLEFLKQRGKTLEEANKFLGDNGDETWSFKG